MKILVIRRDNIGDLVCTLPLIRRLREQYPQAWIGALVTRYNAEVLQGSPDLDAVFSYTKAKHLAAGESALGAMWARLRQLWQLRQMKLDLVLLPASGSQASARRMARLVGAKRVIAQDDVTSDPAALHEVPRAANLLRALDLPVTDLPAARIAPRAELLAAAQAKLGAGPVLGLHISARKPSQRWPAEYFAELIRRLYATDPALRFALFWAPGASDNPLHPGDDAKAQQIIGACGGLPLTPMPTHELSELIAGLAACSRVLCSDGGHMHLAASLGKPIVCLFGKSDAARWHPWGVPYQLLQPASREVGEVTVEEVEAALAALPDVLG
ncbi:glycosyltransferase family 9 protein [Uliginosibacterium sp. TH139]|uniref:glycosyltransferase family 9 protein n=1 Tax=Uliginosibacterium sp. TH139 TaxID=2067453 RepID=UPI000C7C8F58|nr:glycosyltransferase family 9 protein [Uliginosibacterium sp. TH139]PLK49217.1 glycosyl transferase family 9 [Uliginosibacterium sp. TH139]